MRVLLFLFSFLCLSPKAEIFEHVAGGARAQHSDRHFSAYWALWRKPTAREVALFTKQKGTQISQRVLSWKTYNCQNQILSEDIEDFWFEDPFFFDPAQQLIPIAEAKRANTIYSVVFNLNSLYLKNQISFTKPLRHLGESRDNYMKRQKEVFEVFEAFQEQQSARNTKGELEIHLTQKTYLSENILSPFFSLKEMLDDHLLQKEIVKFEPSKWPIYYDERAHKKHRLTAPTLSTGATSIEEFTFHYIFSWDWCNKEYPEFQLKRISGEIPITGPNRPGREESGYIIGP